jgi:hypothetical protein
MVIIIIIFFSKKKKKKKGIWLNLAFSFAQRLLLGPIGVPILSPIIIGKFFQSFYFLFLDLQHLNWIYFVISIKYCKTKDEISSPSLKYIN